MDKTVSRFIRYAQCASESHNEKAFCEYLEQELTNLGLPFERQYLGSEVVTDGWNILARVPGKSGKSPFLFVFHLDTVAPSNHVEVYLEDGKIHARGNSVLGADGKLAIAVVMEVISQLKNTRGLNRPIEMLFTVCQELGLLGAKYADYSQIESDEALVIDHYVTGEVLTKTPARVYVNVELIGCGAHVIRCEDLSANALKTAVEIIHQIPAGRINENLNINVFDLVSLSSSNAVPRHARFDVEIRCFGNDTMKDVKASIQRVVSETAKQMGCKFNITETLDIPESDFSENAELFNRLEGIYEKSGLKMQRTHSFGVLDATCTNRLGIRTVPMGLNIYDSHSIREYVVVEDIKKMYELVENIIRWF